MIKWLLSLFSNSEDSSPFPKVEDINWNLIYDKLKEWPSGLMDYDFRCGLFRLYAEPEEYGGFYIEDNENLKEVIEVLKDMGIIHFEDDWGGHCVIIHKDIL